METAWRNLPPEVVLTRKKPWGTVEEQQLAKNKRGGGMANSLDWHKVKQCKVCAQDRKVSQFLPAAGPLVYLKL